MIKLKSPSIPLILSFLTFSMLLNSMGVIILQLSSVTSSYKGLGILEFFKDLPVAIISIFATNYIHRLGYKKSLFFSLLISGVSCILLPFVNDIWFFRLWFMIIGISFAITKISVFSILKISFPSIKDFTKTMNRIEASFMIGIFLVNIIFAFILHSKLVNYWKFGFWGISVLIFITILSLKNFNSEDYSNTNERLEDFSIKHIQKIFISRNILFFGIIFLIVFIEQGLNSWLPTFFKNQLSANSFFALNSTAFLALFSFLGRYITSNVISNLSIKKYLYFCLIATLLLLIIIQLIFNSVQKENLFIIMFIFPLLGFFVAPFYPLYNSHILSITDKGKVAQLVSFIVLFSSLGSSFGSLYISSIFDEQAQKDYAIFLIAPLIILIILSIFFFRNNEERKIS